MSAIYFDSSSVAQLFLVHASAWLKTRLWFALDGVSRLLLRLVSSPCHPCPPDAYATLIGVDYARGRRWKSPLNIVAELALGGASQRQRQADMVQTLINEVQRWSTEENNNLQEIQRMRAERFLPTPPVVPLDAGGPPPQATPAGRGIIDTRIGKPPVFSGDENTWSDRSFKLRSCVSVVELQLGRMMADAEQHSSGVCSSR